MDRLIDNRKRSAEKRMQMQQQMVDPSLDENAWQLIHEISRQQKVAMVHNPAPSTCSVASSSVVSGRRKQNSTILMSGSSSNYQRR